MYNAISLYVPTIKIIENVLGYLLSIAKICGDISMIHYWNMWWKIYSFDFELDNMYTTLTEMYINL